MMVPTGLYILMPVIALLGTLMGLGTLAAQNETLEQRLKAEAWRLGFAACAIAPADAAPRSAERLRQWLDAGHHGEMLWMEERAGQRGSPQGLRSEEHTSELQSLMRISYAVFCLKKKKQTRHIKTDNSSTNKMSYETTTNMRKDSRRYSR